LDSSIVIPAHGEGKNLPPLTAAPRARFGPLRALALAFVASLFFLPGVFSLPVVDRDEARYAQATRQMLASGDFVDIRFQDEPRHRKPVGIYWLQSLSALAFADDPAQAPIGVLRIPSVLGALAAVLITASTASWLFGVATGATAGVLLASCLLLGVEARSAKTDACLLAAITLVQAVLARCYLDDTDERPTTCVWPFWLGAAAAVLLKGPVVLIVAGGTMVTLAIADRRCRWWRRLWSAWGALLFAALVLPWTLAIAVRSGGAFFATAVGDEIVGRVLHGLESHGAPPGYFAVAFWLTYWPHALLGLAGLWWGWKRRGDAAVRFCLAWIVPTWIIFELVATKLPHYVLPVYPAIAMLAARALLDSSGAGCLRGRGLRYALIAGGSAGVALAAALAVLPGYVHGAPVWSGVAAGAVALLTTIACGAAYRREMAAALIAVATTGALAVYGLTYAALLPGLHEIWLAPRVADLVATQRRCSRTTLTVAGYAEPSLVFALGKDVYLGDAARAARALAADPGCALALVADGDEGDLVAELSAAHVAPRKLGRVSGFNYSKGKWLELTLYAAAP